MSGSYFIQPGPRETRNCCAELLRTPQPLRRLGSGSVSNQLARDSGSYSPETRPSATCTSVKIHLVGCLHQTVRVSFNRRHDTVSTARIYASSLYKVQWLSVPTPL